MVLAVSVQRGSKKWFSTESFRKENGDEKKLREITSAKLKLLQETNMTEFAADLHCQLHGVKDAPAEFHKKNQEVLVQLDKQEQATEKIRERARKEGTTLRYSFALLVEARSCPPHYGTCDPNPTLDN